MENLTLNDPPAPQSASPQRQPLGNNSSNNNGAAVLPGVPHGAPQLPPQMFTTAAQLLDLTDSTCPPFFFGFSGYEGPCVQGKGSIVNCPRARQEKKMFGQHPHANMAYKRCVEMLLASRPKRPSKPPLRSFFYVGRAKDGQS